FAAKPALFEVPLIEAQLLELCGDLVGGVSSLFFISHGLGSFQDCGCLSLINNADRAKPQGWGGCEMLMSSLSAGDRSTAGTSDRHAVGQWAAGNGHVPIIEIVAQLTEKRKAIGINPERHGRQLRIQAVGDSTELGRWRPRGLDSLAAERSDRLDD